MFSFILENALGKRIQISPSLEYSISDIDGLNPPEATINISEVALYDGGKFNSSKVNVRTINISIAINCEAEKNRIALYDVIKSKQWIKIYYENNQRNVYIEGYVQTVNIDYMANPQIVTIAILCPEPYFKDASDIIESINLIIRSFHFPFGIEKEDPIPFGYYGDILEINIKNNGDISCGMTIEISVSGQVINPTIFNRDTREYFGLNYTFESGDTIYITTYRGNKTVKLLRDGSYQNIFNAISKGSTWLQLETGDNVFTYDGEGTSKDYMNVRFIHQDLYEGV